MSGIGRETLPVFRDWLKALPDVWEGSGFPPGCLGVAGRPFRMSGSCREALPDVWEESGYAPECLVGLPGCPGVVGRTSLMSGSVGRTSQMSESG